MAEILETGYQSIRSHIVRYWSLIRIKDESENVIFETGNVNWTHEIHEEEILTGHDPFGKPIYQTVITQVSKDLTFELVIKGSNVSTNATATKLELLDSDRNVVSEETFNPFTFEGAEDELTITHTIEVPQ